MNYKAGMKMPDGRIPPIHNAKPTAIEVFEWEERVGVFGYLRIHRFYSLLSHLPIQNFRVFKDTGIHPIQKITFLIMPIAMTDIRYSEASSVD